MHSPTAALAWELWRRHRSRFLLIAGTVVMFMVVYPVLCAVSGFDPSGRDATGEIARKIAPMMGQPTVVRITQALWLLFLAAGPVMAMVITLIALMWIFTFCEFDPKTSDFLSFPVRLFTLPVSTPFLFWRLVPAGLMAVG